MDEKKTLDEKTLEAVTGGEDWEEESEEYYKAMASFVDANCRHCGNRATKNCPHSNARVAMKHAVNGRCPVWVKKQ